MPRWSELRRCGGTLLRATGVGFFLGLFFELAPLLTALLPDAKARLSDPLAKAGVRVSLHDHHLRVSPSVFNDATDIERLLAALPRA